MKTAPKLLIYLIVGLFSFIFFLYISFPYNVLKETISSQVTNTFNLSISIDDLSSKFPLGLTAEKLSIYNPASGRQFTLQEVKATVSLLPLIIGRVKVNVEMTDLQQGYVDMTASFKLFDLIGQNAAPLPKHVYLESKNFHYGDLVSFALSSKANAEGTNPLLKPLLSKVDVKGVLNSKIDLSLDSDDFSQSKGEAMFNLEGTGINFDKSLQLPDQNFEKALIKLVFNAGQMSIDKTSLIKSQDLEIAFDGKVIQKQKVEKSVFDIGIHLNLYGVMKEQIGFVVDTVANRSNSDGKFKIKISGSLSPQLQVNFL